MSIINKAQVSTAKGEYLVNVVKASSTFEVKIIGYIGWWDTDSQYFTDKVDEALRNGYNNVSLYINSEGGSAFDAFEIVNQLKRFKGTKTCQIGALCASAATIITGAFPVREMAKNGQFMIHEASFSYLYDVRVQDLRSKAQQLENVNTQIADGYEAITNLDRAKITEYMANTEWMTAKVALERGFITSIIEEDATLPANCADVIKNYANLPQNLNQQTVNFNNTAMDKKMLCLLLGISPEASEDDIKNAITTLKNRVETAEANAKKADAENLISLAVAQGKIKPEQKDAWISTAKNDFVGVKAILDGIAPNVTANDTNNNGKKLFVDVRDVQAPPLNIGEQEDKVDAKGKTFNDYSIDEIRDLEASNRPLFNELYKQTYGVSPN